MPDKVGGRKRPPGPGRGHKVKQGDHVSAGEGWGGPATGVTYTAAQLTARAAALRSDPSLRRARDMEKAALAAEMLDLVVNIARTTENENLAATAALKILDRVDPVLPKGDEGSGPIIVYNSPSADAPDA